MPRAFACRSTRSVCLSYSDNRFCSSVHQGVFSVGDREDSNRSRGLEIEEIYITVCKTQVLDPSATAVCVYYIT